MVFDADRRPEVDGSGGAAGPEQRLAAVDLAGGSPRPRKPEGVVRMAGAVVADGMTASEDFGYKSRMAGHGIADEKEGRARPVGVEQVEHRGGACRMGAVVDREPHLALVGAEAVDCRSETSGGGVKYLPGVPRGGQEKDRRSHEEPARRQ